MERSSQVSVSLWRPSKLNVLFLQAMEDKTITNSFTLISCPSILKTFEYEALIADLLNKSLEIMHNRCKISSIENHCDQIFVASILLLFPLSHALDSSLIKHA